MLPLQSVVEVKNGVLVPVVAVNQRTIAKVFRAVRSERDVVKVEDVQRWVSPSLECPR